jgi:transcription antitermination factor NusG
MTREAYLDAERVRKAARRVCVRRTLRLFGLNNGAIQNVIDSIDIETPEVTEIRDVYNKYVNSKMEIEDEVAFIEEAAPYVTEFLI